MQEIESILNLSKRATERGEQVYLATVVHVEGSSYRKPGARMLVTSAGERAGTISGGCLEAEVSRKIRWRAEKGPSLDRYSSSFDDDTEGVPYGLGCQGTVWILVESGEAVTITLDALRRASLNESPSVVVVSLAAGNVGTVLLKDFSSDLHSVRLPASKKLSSELTNSLLDLAARAWRQSRVATSYERTPIGPPAYVCMPVTLRPNLSIYGAGDDVRPLVRFAREVGWKVEVADGRRNLLTKQRFPEADSLRLLTYGIDESGESTLTCDPGLRSNGFAAMLTHSYAQDRAILHSIMPTAFSYLGLLGPRHRTEKLIRGIVPSIGMSYEDGMSRVHSPIGLHFGSDDPSVIALSIISEMQGVLLGNEGRLERPS